MWTFILVVNIEYTAVMKRFFSSNIEVYLDVYEEKELEKNSLTIKKNYV